MKTSKKNKASSNDAIVKVAPRSIPEFTRLTLFVSGGGRCEFDGCNTFLLEHHVTRSWRNFSQVGHIVAFSERGPRGTDSARPADINDVTNLMLLCHRCHVEIDRDPGTYTREVLEQHKHSHEDRIRRLSALGPDRSTTVVVVKARIDNQPIEVPFSHIVNATLPRYPSQRTPFLIDLTAISDMGAHFFQTACEAIDSKVTELLRPGGDVAQTQHISLFALGPMPLLVHLGSRLGNKVPTDLYQRHRDTEDWQWKDEANVVDYRFGQVQEGRSDHVALILSLSGQVTLSDLPYEIAANSTVYKLTLDGVTPDTTFLGARLSLENFRVTYQKTLSTIIGNHGLLEALDVFPAVPAPIAVLCGRELLPKVHPALRIYDYDKGQGGFHYTLSVNQRNAT